MSEHTRRPCVCVYRRRESLYPDDGEYQDQPLCSACYGREVLGVSA